MLISLEVEKSLIACHVFISARLKPESRDRNRSGRVYRLAPDRRDPHGPCDELISHPEKLIGPTYISYKGTSK